MRTPASSRHLLFAVSGSIPWCDYRMYMGDGFRSNDVAVMPRHLRNKSLFDAQINKRLVALPYSFDPNSVSSTVSANRNMFRAVQRIKQFGRGVDPGVVRGFGVATMYNNNDYVREMFGTEYPANDIWGEYELVFALNPSVFHSPWDRYIWNNAAGGTFNTLFGMVENLFRGKISRQVQLALMHGTLNDARHNYGATDSNIFAKITSYRYDSSLDLPCLSIEETYKAHIYMQPNHDEIALVEGNLPSLQPDAPNAKLVLLGSQNRDALYVIDCAEGLNTQLTSLYYAGPTTSETMLAYAGSVFSESFKFIDFTPTPTPREEEVGIRESYCFIPAQNNGQVENVIVTRGISNTVNRSLQYHLPANHNLDNVPSLPTNYGNIFKQRKLFNAFGPYETTGNPYTLYPGCQNKDSEYVYFVSKDDVDVFYLNRMRMGYLNAAKELLVLDECPTNLVAYQYNGQDFFCIVFYKHIEFYRITKQNTKDTGIIHIGSFDIDDGLPTENIVSVCYDEVLSCMYCLTTYRFFRLQDFATPNTKAEYESPIDNPQRNSLSVRNGKILYYSQIVTTSMPTTSLDSSEVMLCISDVADIETGADLAVTPASLFLQSYDDVRHGFYCGARRSNGDLVIVAKLKNNNSEARWFKQDPTSKTFSHADTKESISFGWDAVEHHVPLLCVNECLFVSGFFSSLYDSDTQKSGTIEIMLQGSSVLYNHHTVQGYSLFNYRERRSYNFQECDYLEDTYVRPYSKSYVAPFGMEGTLQLLDHQYYDALLGSFFLIRYNHAYHSMFAGCTVDPSFFVMLEKFGNTIRPRGLEANIQPNTIDLSSLNNIKLTSMDRGTFRYNGLVLIPYMNKLDVVSRSTVPTIKLGLGEQLNSTSETITISGDYRIAGSLHGKHRAVETLVTIDSAPATRVPHNVAPTMQQYSVDYDASTIRFNQQDHGKTAVIVVRNILDHVGGEVW